MCLAVFLQTAHTAPFLGCSCSSFNHGIPQTYAPSVSAFIISAQPSPSLSIEQKGALTNPLKDFIVLFISDNVSAVLVLCAKYFYAFDFISSSKAMASCFII